MEFQSFAELIEDLRQFNDRIERELAELRARNTALFEVEWLGEDEIEEVAA